MDYTEIPREGVTSSNVAEVGYDEKTETLVVKFNKGGLYAYEGVPRNVYNDLMEAPSIGKFLNSQIIPTFKAIKVN